MHVRVAEITGEEYPPCIDEVTTGLEELIPILAKDLQQPKDSRPPDLRLRLCAAVCLGIWREVRGKEQPYSQSCGQLVRLIGLPVAILQN